MDRRRRVLVACGVGYTAAAYFGARHLLWVGGIQVLAQRRLRIRDPKDVAACDAKLYSHMRALTDCCIKIPASNGRRKEAKILAPTR